MLLQPGAGAALAMERVKENLARAAEAAEREAQAKRLLLERCATISSSQELSLSLAHQLAAAEDHVEKNSLRCVKMVHDTFEELRQALDLKEREMIEHLDGEKAAKVESIGLEQNECKGNQRKVATHLSKPLCAHAHG